jgi:hypothetical protein
LEITILADDYYLVFGLKITGIWKMLYFFTINPLTQLLPSENPLPGNQLTFIFQSLSVLLINGNYCIIYFLKGEVIYRTADKGFGSIVTTRRYILISNNFGSFTLILRAY